MVDEGRPMALCGGCGFHVELEDVRERDEHDDECLTCVLCEAEPRMKESYRRGFNAGLDAMKDAVVQVAEKSNLRRRSTR